MASLFSSGIGGLLRTLGAQSCGNQALRCNGSVGNRPFYAAIRWFTNGTGSDNRPKRPLSSYIRYVQEQRPFYKKQYPDAPVTELTKFIATSWNQLLESQKKVYVEAAQKDLQVYKTELRAYESQLSVAQMLAIKEEKQQRRLKRRKARQKRELTVLGKPKRPRSAFNIFMTEHFEEASGNFPVTKLKTLWDNWSKLSDAQKQPYFQLAKDDQIRYENEMKSWEEQMLEIGRIDVIRSRSRRKMRKALTLKTAEETKRSGSHSEKTGKSRKSSPPKSGKHESEHTTEE